MAKGSKKGNGGQKSKQPMRLVKNLQSDGAKKKRNVNEINEVTALSWNSEEDDDDEGSNASTDMHASVMDRAHFESARNQVSNWIASIHTPLHQSGLN